jgi:hypothetical protein
MTKEEILEKMVNKHTQDVDSTKLATLLHSMIERIEKLEKNAKDDHRTLGKLYQQSCTHEDGVGSICNYCGKDLADFKQASAVDKKFMAAFSSKEDVKDIYTRFTEWMNGVESKAIALERQRIVEMIKKSITDETIEALFADFYHGDWVRGSGDWIELYRVSSHFKDEIINKISLLGK